MRHCTSLYNQPTYQRIYRQFGDSYPEKTFNSRTSHVLVLHESNRKCYIIGGHRTKTYLRDVLVYDLDQDRLEQWSDFVLRFPPEYYSGGFTIRATLDPNTDEMFIFTVSSLKQQIYVKKNTKNYIFINSASLQVAALMVTMEVQFRVIITTKTTIDYQWEARCKVVVVARPKRRAPCTPAEIVLT